jgi:hypothetical protein
VGEHETGHLQMKPWNIWELRLTRKPHSVKETTWHWSQGPRRKHTPLICCLLSRNGTDPTQLSNGIQGGIFQALLVPMQPSPFLPNSFSSPSSSYQSPSIAYPHCLLNLELRYSTYKKCWVTKYCLHIVLGTQNTFPLGTMTIRHKGMMATSLHSKKIKLIMLGKHSNISLLNFSWSNAF